MRSLLVHAAEDGTFEARLQVGLDLARRFDAHLTFLQTVAFDMVIPTDPFIAVGGELSTITKQRAAEFRTEITDRLANEDVRWDWQEETGYDGSSMLKHASLNDLALVGARIGEGKGSATSPLAGVLAIHCRAPVLVVPGEWHGINVDAPAMVCWNGSIQAARAMRAAVPLLRCAEKVHLVSVGDKVAIDAHELPASAAIAYLDRHGVDCEAVDLPRGSDSIEDVLRSAARAREAGMLVMGAYGQPRFYETLFGGTTRTILSRPTMPVLMAH